MPTLAFAGAFAGSSAHLRIQVEDPHGSPLWTRLEVRNASGEMFQPADSIHENMKKTRGGKPYYLHSFIVHGVADLDLAPGTYTVIAEHGLEYQRIEREIRVAHAPVHLRLRLHPWIRMREKGWWSGDMHVHRPIEDAPGIAQAEDLNYIVLVSRGKQDLFRPDHWPAEPVIKADDGYWISLRNAEDERRGGSWILNGLRSPLALVGPEGGWFPPGLNYVREARAQRAAGAALPWFDIDMPFWWEAPVMMALALPDSLDILHNQFMQYGIDESEYWGRPRNRADYPGWQGFADYCFDLYYRYLNLGLHVPPSAGTGTGVMPSPAGYDRVYAQIDGPFAVDKWYAAIRAGRSFVTNGPMLFTEVRRRAGSLTIEARALAREPIDRIELVANGKIVARVSAAKARFTIDPRQYAWCAVRCFLKTPDNIRLAHSTPIYLDGRCDNRADAAYFVAWLDDLMAQTMQDAKRFRNDEERDMVMGNYRDARAFYRSRE